MSFEPFNDLQPPIITPPSASQGYDTIEIDAYRQGVEITNSRVLYAGTQPKIWAGNLEHEIDPYPLGQTLPFSEAEGIISYTETQNFIPADYIALGDDYPFPILLNEGPQQEEEGYIEPLTIPFRKRTNEGPVSARRIYAILEDGNQTSDMIKASSRITQFIELYNQISGSCFFLESGGGNFGNLSFEGYLSEDEKVVVPFRESVLDEVINLIDTTDSAFRSELDKLKIDLNNDLRPVGYKSACAGYSSSQTVFFAGTESIAFYGTMRGV